MKPSLKILPLALLMSASALAANSLGYKTVVDVSQYKGSTYFSLMSSVIKPALDKYAASGFVPADGKKMMAGLKKVDAKVMRNALRSAGSAENLKAISDKLSSAGPISFYNLPEAVSRAGRVQDRYGLATFISLISGGGVAVKIDEKNTTYNVNYGTGATEKDEMTGRSFGEGPLHLSSDASDKMYLLTLENYVRSEGDATAAFYKSLLEILVNCDPSNFKLISPAGQTLASDFLAVYTAEQDRHLMADLKSHHWDSALLEVTLLSAFHAGQKNIMVMYNGELTATTAKQAPGCDEGERVAKKASMIDYWQFSSSTDPESCNRSGINVTKREFRSLTAAITRYERANNPEIVSRVERHFRSQRKIGNLFSGLSDFLINYRTPSQLDKATLTLPADFTAFLMQVKNDANKISASITNGETQTGEE